MKKIAILIMALLFTGCTGGLVTTQNGSFKSSLKQEYPPKSCYKFTNESQESGIMVAGALLGGLPGLVVGAGVSDAMDGKVSEINVDQATRICTIRALNSFSRIRADRLTNEGIATIPSIHAIPRYREGAIVGVEVAVIENIPHKEYRKSLNHQEWTVDSKGKWYLLRENISESESWGKYVRYIEKL